MPNSVFKEVKQIERRFDLNTNMFK